MTWQNDAIVLASLLPNDISVIDLRQLTVAEMDTLVSLVLLLKSAGDEA